MTNNKAPCFNCQNRQVGCHSNCQSYLDYQAKNSAIQTKRIEEHEKAYKLNGCLSKATTARMYLGW